MLNRTETTTTSPRGRLFAPALLLVLALGFGGCGDSAGEGSLAITTYGEDFIEKEIPAAGSGGEGVVDGYTITFDTFLVTLTGIKVADREGTVAAEQSGAVVVDVHKAGPHTVASFAALPAQRWDEVGVTVAPATSARGVGVSADQLKLMADGGYSVYVAGKAVKGSDSFTFKWGFTTGTRYEECTEKSTGEGVVIPSGGSATAQFTIHGDHLFYDDLQSSDPSLRFAAMAAADADADGEVTLAELAKVDLTTLPSGQYGTGGAGSIKNLGQFVTALSRTLVHYQGEGHCHSTITN